MCDPAYPWAVMVSEGLGVGEEATMAAVKQEAGLGDRATGQESESEAELTIALDPHRPGVERGRLVHYGLPVWALIGHLHGAALDDEEAIAQTAADYCIPPAAVRAAIGYDRRHEGPIDALLARNSAATYAVFDE